MTPLETRMELEPLPRSVYEPPADVVAPELLGHWLVRQTEAGVRAGIIVETEAYLTGDPACHAFRGTTPRNRVMWGPPGHAYVYFIYGCHFCVNAVCRPPGTGEAVLIRALEPTHAVDAMVQRRGGAPLGALTNGPGKLCAALDITRELDGADLTDLDSPLVVIRNPGRAAFVARHGAIVRTPRIGIRVATDWPLRFCLRHHPHLSRRVCGDVASVGRGLPTALSRRRRSR